jgi:hypothetical protein
VGIFDRLKGDRPTVHLDATRNVKVVGMNNYATSLQRVVKAHPEHREGNGAPRVAFTATLVAQRANPHDPNAIAVYWKRHMIGHLPRDEAAKYRDTVEQAAQQGRVTADGTIYAGHKGGSSWSVGVKLPKL